MLLPPQSGGISMTFTTAFCIKTIFEMASKKIFAPWRLGGRPFSDLDILEKMNYIIAGR